MKSKFNLENIEPAVCRHCQSKNIMFLERISGTARYECHDCGELFESSGRMKAQKLDGEADFTAVAGKLQKLGYADAQVVHTGGNIHCIEVPCGLVDFLFGTSGETWGADVYQGTGGWMSEGCEFVDGASFSTDCPSELEDPEAVALAIRVAVRKYLAEQTAKSNPEAARVAREFSQLLAKELNADQRSEILTRNAIEEPNTPAGLQTTDICHSHDVCDANMVMDAALRNLGREPLPSGESERETACAFWNEAWNIAKNAQFFWDVKFVANEFNTYWEVR